MSVQEVPENETSPLISQMNFQETTYADAHWEVVGERFDSDEFVPLELGVLRPSTVKLVDPMFQDFGGTVPAEHGETIWHLPTEEAAAALRAQEVEFEIPEGCQLLTEEAIEELKAQAREEGLALGRQEAQALASEQTQILQGRVVEFLEDLAKQCNEAHEENERECVKLAVAIADKLVHGAIEVNPEYVLPLVKESLEHAGSAEVRKVRLSPADFEFIEVMGLHDKWGKDAGWIFEADASIKAGCIVDTSAGEIDYQVDKAWDRVKHSILKIAK
jgi:flagellar assembly protein FliH